MCSQIVVEPVERRHDRNRLVAKSPHELHRELAVEGSGAKQFQRITHASRGLIGEAQKVIRHFVCARPHLAGADDGLRDPS